MNATELIEKAKYYGADPESPHFSMFTYLHGLGLRGVGTVDGVERKMIRISAPIDQFDGRSRCTWYDEQGRQCTSFLLPSEYTRDTDCPFPFP